MAEPTTTIQDLLDGDLFEIVGLGSMSIEEKEEFMSTMLQTVYARTLLQVENLLEGDDKQAFADLHADQMMEFLQARDFDLVTMLAEEAVRYRQEIIMTYVTARSEYFEVNTPSEIPLAQAA